MKHFCQRWNVQKSIHSFVRSNFKVLFCVDEHAVNLVYDCTQHLVRFIDGGTAQFCIDMHHSQYLTIYKNTKLLRLRYGKKYFIIKQEAFSVIGILLSTGGLSSKISFFKYIIQ